MRGKPFLQCKVFLQYRITPAGAGKTRQAQPSCLPRRDHPRRCGENPPPMFAGIPIAGSPPQVRGKLTAPISRRSRWGITPAGAGKTSTLHGILKTAQDHPRRCGENQLYIIKNDRYLGSPPQVRGKPAMPCLTFVMPGITPAGAGKTILL